MTALETAQTTRAAKLAALESFLADPTGSTLQSLTERVDTLELLMAEVLGL